MVSVTVSHLIGTISLLTIFVSVGTYYTLFYSNMNNEIITVQLGKIANYIGSNIVDMVTVCYVSETDQLLVKELDLSASITGFNYDISLERIGNKMSVRVYLISETDIFGEYVLPWSTGKIDVYDESDSEIEDYIHSKNPSLNPDFLVYNGEYGIALWCSKIENNIVVGLGLIS